MRIYLSYCFVQDNTFQFNSGIYIHKTLISTENKFALFGIFDNSGCALIHLTVKIADLLMVILFLLRNTKLTGNWDFVQRGNRTETIVTYSRGCRLFKLIEPATCLASSLSIWSMVF